MYQSMERKQENSSTIDRPNHLLKRVGRNPVAKALRNAEFHQRIVPAEKIYKRNKFKNFDYDEEDYAS